MRVPLPVAVLAALTASALSAQPTPETVLERAIAYHDPQNVLLTQAHRFSFLETRPDAPDRHSEVVIDVARDDFYFTRRGEHTVAGRLEGGHCEVSLDGRTELTEEERAEHRLDCDRLERMRNYYVYLWGLPMKLRDPGTRLGVVTRTKLARRSVYALRVTYEESVGKDTWIFYFDRGSYALVGYRFFHDESKNDGEYIVLEGEARLGRLRLPKHRTWYTHQGNRLLGTDTLESIERVSD